jgi:hypothetical protein
MIGKFMKLHRFVGTEAKEEGSAAGGANSGNFTV